MSTEIRKDPEMPRTILELEKFRQDIESELAKRHAAQEQFWERQQANLEQQERYWRWQQWVLVATFALGVAGLVFGRFWH